MQRSQPSILCDIVLLLLLLLPPPPLPALLAARTAANDADLKERRWAIAERHGRVVCAEPTTLLIACAHWIAAA